MERYLNLVKLENARALSEKGDYAGAREAVAGIRTDRIKNPADILLLAQIYKQNEEYDAARHLLLRVYEKRFSRRLLEELLELCLLQRDAEGAQQYFETYKKISGGDCANYIYEYRIGRLLGKPYEELLPLLQTLKAEEYTEKYAYELAKVYHKLGRQEECLAECNDIILWFGKGRYVEHARVLRAYYSGELPLEEIMPQEETPAEEAAQEAEAEFTAVTRPEEDAAAWSAEEAVQEAETEFAAVTQPEEDAAVMQPQEDAAVMQPQEDAAAWQEEEFTAATQLQKEFVAAWAEEKEDVQPPKTGGAVQTSKKRRAKKRSKRREAARKPEAAERVTEKPKAEAALQNPEAERVEEPLKSEAMLQNPETERAEEPYKAEAALQRPETERVEEPYKAEAALQSPETERMEEPLKSEAMLQSPETERVEEPLKAGAALQSPETGAVERKSQIAETMSERFGQLSFLQRGTDRAKGGKEPEIIGGELERRLAKAKLTPEEVLRNFMRIEPVKNQLVHSLNVVSGAGEGCLFFIIAGAEKSGKTTLGKNMAKLLYRLNYIRQPKVAAITGERLNGLSLEEKRAQLKGCCLIVEKAGKMKREAGERLMAFAKNPETLSMVILEDEPKEIDLLLRNHPDWGKAIGCQIRLPKYSTADLLGFAADYASEQDYTIEEDAKNSLLGKIATLTEEERKKEGLARTLGFVKAALEKAEERNRTAILKMAASGSFSENDLLTIKKEDIESP